MQQDYKTILY